MKSAGPVARRNLQLKVAGPPSALLGLLSFNTIPELFKRNECIHWGGVKARVLHLCPLPLRAGWETATLYATLPRPVNEQTSQRFVSGSSECLEQNQSSSRNARAPQARNCS